MAIGSQYLQGSPRIHYIFPTKGEKCILPDPEAAHVGDMVVVAPYHPNPKVYLFTGKRWSRLITEEELEDLLQVVERATRILERHGI